MAAAVTGAAERAESEITTCSPQPACTAAPHREALSAEDFLEDRDTELMCPRTVGELMEHLTEQNNTLKEQVLTVSSLPPKVSAALSAVEDARCSLEALLQREQLTFNMLHKHLQDAQPWMDKLEQTCNQVDFIERHMKYLRCLQHIEELSATVQQCLMTSSAWEAIRAVDSMAALDYGLNQSRCSHLQNFLQATLSFWHKIMKDRLTSDFEKLLTQLHWPIVSPPTQSLTPTPSCQETEGQLELLVGQLLALQTSPEWYLTQVLMWMGNNSAFMEETIQPVLDRGRTTLSAKVELCRGLLSLVQEKVASDASKLLYDDVLFCHLVEEVLQFEKELRSNHSYPAELPGVLHLLLEDAVLQKWLTMEKKMAVEKMDAMLSAERAWSSQYKDISDMDDLKAPDCAETFMTLLQVITERYRTLPCPSAQLKFLELQKELVDDFRIRLTQVMKEESRCPLGVRYCAILNAVNYISTILGDWGNDVFFLQLQQTAVSLGEEAVPGGLGIMEMGRLASLEGSLFDGLLALLDRLKGDMLGRLLDFLMREIKEKAKPYCQERWLSLPSQQDQSTMSLSSTACPMMLCVRDRLLNLHQVLGFSLFHLAWQGLAERLDNFLYQDVSSQCSLNPPHCYCSYSVSEQSDMTRDCAGTGDPPPESALNELGVFCLAPCDVLILLSLRTSWFPS
ncbi:RAD50-interacting protein 1 [Neolamprologus brichardi]|uniref:RAD50-interacting protein 1 n=1 Tax=Neolamprologus brichardi TaxID=32507 RepID=UPI001643F36C|nr:RAD50-interacting protein 1 [Neolamprologus brichardi]